MLPGKPSLEGTHAFAECETRRLAERGRPDLKVEPMQTARKAIEGADLICTVTSSHQPVLRGEWVSPGVHTNAVGTFQPTTRELDTHAVLQESLFID